MPNGRTIWCLRLRQGNRIVRTVVSTETLRRYARLSGLAELLAAVEAAASPEAA
ncbi:MAG TPA: hypothetical protein VJQ43_06855 [Thermoplasmata archaeon]|nr:hypothetical protein [Thermoplasmata archaeon]